MRELPCNGGGIQITLQQWTIREADQDKALTAAILVQPRPQVNIDCSGAAVDGPFTPRAVSFGRPCWVLWPLHTLKVEGIAMNCPSMERLNFAHHTVPDTRIRMRSTWAPAVLACVVFGVLSLASAATGGSSPVADQKSVAALDKEYQKAVEQNDARAMARILADDYVLVTGNGKIYTKADLVDDAKSGKTHYEHQEDTEQTVRIWGNTAVITAKLWAKGIEDGKPVDYKLWFSDTYVRTPKGWSYVFGQASLPLPSEQR